jgi:hypothetical protein
MLYAQYIRSMEMVSPQGTASVKLTTAGDTAKKMRHEYIIGGDTEDLLVLIDKIKRHKADPGIQIIPKTYVKNGRVYNSDRPGAIVMYSWSRVDFGEVHYNGEYTIKMGARAGQTVSSYKLVAPQVWLNVDNLFRTDRLRFDALSPAIKDAYLMGTLCSNVAFKPAICNPETGQLVGAEGIVDANDGYSDEERDNIDGLNETPEAPTSDDEGAPF